MYTLFLTSILTPLFFYAPFTYTPLISPPFISTPLLVLIFVLLYFYASIPTPSFLTPYYSPPLYVHIICTPFSSKIFLKKISTLKAYPKNFPKIFTYYNYSSPLLFNRKVNSSYSFYKILNTKFWRFYETIKTNKKNYYGFR